MVWMHGGFLQFGSSHQPGISPSGKLAKKLDTVFVSFNYRLHALGFLALNHSVTPADAREGEYEKVTGDSANGPEQKLSGNYGLWDQVMALTWVQQNIQFFGGDAERVMLFGPDSTGAAVLALMSNQAVSQGLFQSAWIMDPAIFLNKSADEVWSSKAQDSFLLRSGCSTVACLRGMPAEAVTRVFLGNDDPSFRINDQNDLPIQGIFPQQLIVIDGTSSRLSFLCSLSLPSNWPDTRLCPCSPSRTSRRVASPVTRARFVSFRLSHLLLCPVIDFMSRLLIRLLLLPSSCH